MSFWTLSGLTLIRYSTMLWVYLGMRLFLCLAFIIGIIYYGARLKRKSIPTGTQPQKNRFVSLGIGWSPRKEERRQEPDRRQSHRTAWIASLTLLLGVGIGVEGTKAWQLYRSGIITQAVVDEQNENYLTWHYLDDTSVPHRQYTENLCINENMPHFQARQIIEEMRYVRVTIGGKECEDFTPANTTYRIARLHGVPILQTGE